MKTYSIQSESYRQFYLIEEGRKIGKLEYPNWFSFKATLNTEGKTYAFEPKGFWGTTIELKDHGKLLLNFKMHWNGQIIINTHFYGIEADYIFRHKGLLKSAYVLLSKENQELVVIEPHYKWKTFSADYTITAAPEFEAIMPKNILLLCMVHCSNYYMNAVSGATAS